MAAPNAPGSAKGNRQRVLKAVLEAGKPVTVRDAALAAGFSYELTRRNLAELSDAGKLWRNRASLTGTGRRWVWLYSAGEVTSRDIEQDAEWELPRKPPPARTEWGESERLMRLANSTKTMGHRGLVCAILIVAIRDWRCPDPGLQRFVDRCRSLDADCDWESPRDELLDFWEGEDGQLYREALGCGMLDLRDIAADPSVQGRPERWG